MPPSPLIRPLLLVCAAALSIGVTFGGKAQPAMADIYFLGISDRNGDGVSDLSDGVNLYAVTGEDTARLNTGDENVRSYLPDWERGSVAYLAATPAQETSLTLISADGQRRSISLTGLQAPLLERCADTVWISAQDESSRALVIGYDLKLTEVARAVIPLSHPLFAFDPTGQWLTAYDQTAQKLMLYRLPNLTPTPLPGTVSPWGPPVWARHSARFALPIEDGGALNMALIDPAADLRRSDDLGLSTDRIRLIQPQWSADERYLTYRTLPGADLASALALRLIDAETLALTTLAENDTQLRVVAWSDDDRYALVSESSAALSEQISVNDRLYDPAKNQLLPGNQASALIAPVAFAWQPGTHLLGILGTSQIDGKAGIYTFNAATAELVTLYQTDREDILNSSLTWSGDGTKLLFTARSNDPVNLLTGNSNLLRMLDIRTGNTVILSPDDVAVLPYGIQIR